MKKWLVGAGLLIFCAPLLVVGAVLQTGKDIPSGEIVEGNLYLAGSDPSIGGDVQGDLVIAGGNVYISGTVEEDVMAAGGNLEITGNIGGDLRIAGGKVNVNSKIGGEVFIFAGDVVIGPNAEIAGDLVVNSGNFNKNDAAIVGGNEMIQTGSEGKMISEEFEAKKEQVMRFLTITYWVSQVLAILGLLFTGAVFYGLFNKITNKSVTSLFSKSNFWINLGIGFLFFVATPIASFILLFTGIGALLSFILLLGYALTILVAIAFAGIIFGGLMQKIFKKNKKGLNWGFVILGIVVLHLLSLLPIVGLLIGFFFMLVSMGTLLRMKWEYSRG